MRALDLFAGAGGWDIAAKRLGIHADGVEIMREANETRVAAGLHTVGHDVWNYDLNVGYDYDGLIASPPCQTFSLAGKGKGREALDDVIDGIRLGEWHSLDNLREYGQQLGDERTALVLAPLHYIDRMNPGWVALEQVPTVLPVWEVYAEVLRGYDYSVWTGNLQAEQYGVPQTRKRAFLLASRTREVGRPEPTHSRYYPRTPERLDEGVKKWISMAEALGWVEDGLMVSNYGTGGDAQKRGVRLFTDPAPTVTSHINRNKLYVDEGGANYMPAYYRSTTMPNSARRPVGTPAPTIAFGHDAASAQWISEEGLGERVTVREAGILQSFPPDHPWHGAKGRQYLQVGNAVPPLLAEAVLSAVAG
jgi:DNA (cytosine-5)-methyltransferase 1